VLPVLTRSTPFGIRAAIGIVACVALVWYYTSAAVEHGRRVNTSKARGDQSGYLWDAQNVYANWHGRQPPTIIGERNRMPLYAGYLALFYHTGLSDPQFFEVAKKANVGLSLGLLAILGLAFAGRLPLHVAGNLLGVVAFGYFVYKAGYAQSELLFCLLIFLTFLGCWRLFGVVSGWRSATTAALTGAAAGLAQLTKAAMLPLVVIFLTIYLGRLAWSIVHQNGTVARRPTAAWQLVSATLFALAFMAVLWPYLSTSKRVFGQYFYNVNSTFYVWYDDWAHASIGTYVHGDAVGWPTLPASELPGPARYWREHSLRRIGARVRSGFADMARTSYATLGYFPYLVVFCAALSFVAVTRRQALAQLVREHAWLAAFLATYAGVYLLAIAFYYPTSGTGTGRFVVPHLTPFFFSLSCCLSSRTMLALRWSLAGRSIGIGSLHALITILLVLDVTFRVWPRLMTTYGGF
jgi:hypothetical protein